LLRDIKRRPRPTQGCRADDDDDDDDDDDNCMSIKFGTTNDPLNYQFLLNVSAKTHIPKTALRILI
jgi:hypothetical protein